jgi:hypothetical protein
MNGMPTRAQRDSVSFVTVATSARVLATCRITGGVSAAFRMRAPYLLEFVDSPIGMPRDLNKV